MKKFILGAIAAGALAASSVASAQWGNGINNAISSIFGYGGSSGSTPAVVAGANQSIQVDAYGRRFYHDQWGRQVFVDNNMGTYGSYGVPGSYGSYGVGSGPGRILTDAYGRPVTMDEHGTYVDASGVRMHIDAYGRHVRLDQYGSYRDQWGRLVYLGADRQPRYMEQNGRLAAVTGDVYGSNAYGGGIAYGGAAYPAPGYGAGSWDRDGDGVANHADRWPDDSRYR
jgi:hypothetical protein